MNDQHANQREMTRLDDLELTLGVLTPEHARGEPCTVCQRGRDLEFYDTVQPSVARLIWAMPLARSPEGVTYLCARHATILRDRLQDTFGGVSAFELGALLMAFQLEFEPMWQEAWVALSDWDTVRSRVHAKRLRWAIDRNEVHLWLEPGAAPQGAESEED